MPFELIMLLGFFGSALLGLLPPAPPKGDRRDFRSQCRRRRDDGALRHSRAAASGRLTAPPPPSRRRDAGSAAA